MTELSPVMTLFREFEVKYAQAGDLTTDEYISNSLMDECRELEARMMALPSSNAQDLAAKLVAFTRYGGFSLSDPGEGSPLDEALAILAVQPVEHPDAELLKLGEQHRAARQAEIALYKEIGDDESPETMERVDKCSFEMGRISNAILAIKPQTVEGLRVVAQVWGGCHINHDGSWPPDDVCTDTRAVQAIMRWLIGGGASCD